MGPPAAAVGAGQMEPIARSSGRVLVVDAAERVLLLRGSDPGDRAAGDWWFTPGGGLDPGETAQAGARRELREETGLDLPDLGAPVWVRTAEFTFLGRRYTQHETFFLARVERHEVDFSGHTDIEREAVHEFRWWPLDDLQASAVTVYPRALAAELATVLEQVAGGQWPQTPKDVGP
jgi:8-oxo-dGTP pyrophosphatase MutT (NUDIX family)